MKRIYYIVMLAILLFSCEKGISPYQSENFIKYFGSGHESKGYDVIQLSDGNYIFTGYDKNSLGNYQVFTVKVDKNGNEIWSKYWGTSNREEGKVIKEVSDGFLIAGTTLKTTGITHSFLMKISFEGDSLWFKEYGGTNTSLIVNDILLGESNIYLVGKSYSVNEISSDCYFRELDYNGNGSINRERISWAGTGSLLNKGFIQNSDLLFAGTYGATNKVILAPTYRTTLWGTYKDDITSENNVTGDAIYSNDMLYLLVNEITQSNTSVKVLKLSSSYVEEWHTETINSTEGKSFTLKDDGSLLVCGEQIDGTESRIYFIKVEPDGSVQQGVDFFRTFPGYVGKVIETKDKGIILVGTSSTNGTMVQLIKTDNDLFLFKN